MTEAEFHRQLLDNLSTPVLVVEPDFSVCFISPAAQALLELSQSRSLGTSLDTLLPGHGLLLAGAGGDERASYTNRGLKLRLAGGRQLTVDCTVTSLPDLSRIIIELHPLDRILRINREKGLLSSQEITWAVLRGLAHEIKNPLGGLRGAAQLLARELPNPALREYTNIIIEESDRLRDLVDRMLGPHQQPRFEFINIHEILDHVRKLLLAEVGEEINFVYDYDPSLPEISGDRSQLIQAILNIVRNAMQATEGNEGRREIVLRSRIQRQVTIGANRYRLVCRIDIADNGSGIPAPLRHTVFVPMVSGRADGSGLGLAISQSIVNHHKGLIECASEPGSTVFTLYIPLEENSAKTS